MQKYALPTCYFPSTVIFVDDSREFLMNFTLQLDDNLNYKIFDSPFDALEAVYRQQETLKHLSQRCVTEYIDGNSWPMTNQTVNLDLGAIHAEVYNPQRFAEVSVVVVDYAMPGMNGLEFCQRIENSAIKKILLTGQADERTALEAFNQGIIHRYIQKNEPNVTQNIINAIDELQRTYFQHMSHMVNQMLCIHSPSCLQDEKFITFFKKLREEHNIVEFYLTENSGSFLMLDTAGRTSGLIMKNEQDLNMHYELALDNKAPQEILDDLRTGKKIPAFWQANGYQSEWSEWSTFLVPAKQLQCNDTYYYAYVQDHFALDIQKEKIQSYKKFIENADKSLNH